MPDDRCTHTSSDGRRCVLIRAGENYPFCAYHAMDESLPNRGRLRRSQLPHPEASGRDQRFGPPEEDVTADLLGPAEDFCSATAINLALRRLVNLLASNRISPRRAAVLAYTFQLLLQSLPGVKQEFKEFKDLKEFKELTNSHELPDESRGHCLTTQGAGAAFPCSSG